ncbi:MAG: hypothetical protein AB7U29_00445 [Desulfobulbus sp.]
MHVIDSSSRVTAELTLTWHSSDAMHIEKLWAHPVSFCRDALDSTLIKQLVGKGVGGRARVAIPASQFTSPYSANKRAFVRPHQFRDTDIHGNVVTPTPGRFYP